MKKLLRMAMAFALVIGMTTSVFAAGSKTEGIESSAGKGADGKDVKATVSAVASDSDKLTEEQAAEELKKLDVPGEIENIQTVDVTVPKGTKFPVTLTFDVPAAPGQKVIVLHWNGSTWDPAGEGTDPQVSATFDSLSPVGFVFLTVSTDQAQQTTTPAASSNNTSTTTKTSSTSAASPKTGEQDLPLMAWAVALLAGGAACMSYRKKAA